MQSNNWADGGVTGSEFDLNEGTIRLGGDAPNTSILLSGSGGGHLASNAISWDESGNTNISGSVTIHDSVTINADISIGSLPNTPSNTN